MFVRLLLPALLTCAMLADTAAAQQEKLQIDPAASTVHFALTGSLHSVDGTFKVQQGSIVFNRADGAMQGEVAVDAASGDSGDSSRDKKMTANQMKAPSFSTVTFMPHHFTGTLNPSGDSNITVAGTFTLLGKPHEITVPMKVHLQGSSCTATGSFTVPYVAWGMKDPSVFLLKVGKEVVVNLALTGSVAP